MITNLLEKEKRRYLERTSRSKEIFQTARQYVAGGVSRSPLYYDPYPVVVKEGRGAEIEDVDGNVYLDFINNFTSLILGHAHPAIVQAVEEALEKGTAFAAPVQQEQELARLISERLPSVQRLRFTNSGTEAVMYAIKTARAFTGRPKIAKFEGAFHGGYDAVQVSVKVVPGQCGPREAPTGCAGRGITPAALGEVVILPFNNAKACREIIWREREELAAVIIDPLMCVPGVIIPTREFITELRHITEECDVLLIFDEVVSLRMGMGGAQEYYGVTPDLTALGKIIGGGFPVGAFGGREEIMRMFNPPQEGGYLQHGGTFNANPITLAAGLATLRLLNEDLYGHLNSLGDLLRNRVVELFLRYGVEAQVTGLGSLFNFHFTREPIVDYRATLTGDKEMLQYIFFGLANRGIYVATRGYGCISAPMTEKDVKVFLQVMEELIEAVVS